MSDSLSTSTTGGVHALQALVAKQGEHISFPEHQKFRSSSSSSSLSSSSISRVGPWTNFAVGTDSAQSRVPHRPADMTRIVLGGGGPQAYLAWDDLASKRLETTKIKSSKVIKAVSAALEEQKRRLTHEIVDRGMVYDSSLASDVYGYKALRTALNIASPSVPSATVDSLVSLIQEATNQSVSQLSSTVVSNKPPAVKYAAEAELDRTSKCLLSVLDELVSQANKTSDVNRMLVEVLGHDLAAIPGIDGFESNQMYPTDFECEVVKRTFEPSQKAVVGLESVLSPSTTVVAPANSTTLPPYAVVGISTPPARNGTQSSKCSSIGIRDTILDVPYIWQNRKVYANPSNPSQRCIILSPTSRPPKASSDSPVVSSPINIDNPLCINLSKNISSVCEVAAAARRKLHLTARDESPSQWDALLQHSHNRLESKRHFHVEEAAKLSMRDESKHPLTPGHHGMRTKDALVQFEHPEKVVSLRVGYDLSVIDNVKTAVESLPVSEQPKTPQYRGNFDAQLIAMRNHAGVWEGLASPTPHSSQSSSGRKRSPVLNFKPSATLFRSEFDPSVDYNIIS